jgi:hypothetical protein
MSGVIEKVGTYQVVERDEVAIDPLLGSARHALQLLLQS